MLKSELRKTYKGLKKKRNIQKVLYIAMNLRKMKRKKIFHLSTLQYGNMGGHTIIYETNKCL